MFDIIDFLLLCLTITISDNLHRHRIFFLTVSDSFGLIHLYLTSGP